MNVNLQEQLSPHTSNATRDFSSVNVKKKEPTEKVADVDFKNLLLESNKEVVKQREKAKRGDLSEFKNYEEFLDHISNQKTEESRPKNTLDKDDFLKLFITQLQNQDPLNPKDGTEMASQLAQFNGLEQMMNVNKSLETLQKTTEQNQSLNLTSYLGKEISLNTPTIFYQKEKPIFIDADFKTPTQMATLQLENSKGEIILKKELGPQKTGSSKININDLTQGLSIPEGTYKPKLSYLNPEGVEENIELNTKTTITGIQFNNEEKPLSTTVGDLSITDIKSIHSLEQEPKTTDLNKAKVEKDPQIQSAATAQVQNEAQTEKQDPSLNTERVNIIEEELLPPTVIENTPQP
jgi:flagellar basal-body rod modification protein FlgD